MASLLLDTNVLHYAGGSSPENRVQAFWQEVMNAKHDLYISDETVREIEVQFVNMNHKLKKRIQNGVLPFVKQLPYVGSIEREQRVKLAAAYARRNFDIKVPSSGKLMEYPSTSDARILLTAYDHDCIVVTRNVRDFMIYLCFGYQIWDPVMNQFIGLSKDVWEKVKGDSHLQGMLANI